LAVDDLVEICHGSPMDEDLYIFDETDALRALKSTSRQLCLFGHTHFPITFQLAGGELQATGPSAAPEALLELKDDVLYLVNPGAVGQPRDGDARAAYAIVDVERKRVELLRLEYRIEAAQAKVVDAGLPVVLAKRLAVGR
jgi:diadenosine tetraphosphatase ApaH/serine/threonine PP2A family protein phosphatase